MSMYAKYVVLFAGMIAITFYIFVATGVISLPKGI